MPGRQPLQEFVGFHYPIRFDEQTNLEQLKPNQSLFFIQFGCGRILDGRRDEKRDACTIR